ncbi:membrane progestin receptor beta-like [Boleophthalmus pectinirostris]|uniref:membrane progestin receptor beta-like n=1 Tax=Boleophthalmus pectinirostris TaxID=150288 RepID=UPI000A1C6126|nr:membrane progestin receptor beta-like [Boleophthalmus pectinirostris]
MSSVSLSLPSMPAPLLSILRKLLPSLPPTGRDMDVPPLYREAFVLSGYRPLGLPWRCYVLSLFQMHKDTVTVWCPLLAAVAMMVRFLFFTVLQGGGVLGVRLWAPEGPGVSLDPSSLPLLLYVLSAVLCLSCNAVSLLLYPYTSCVRSCLLLLDSVGRGVHQAGRALALSLYSSDASWTESAVGQLYFPTAAVLAWLSCTTGCCVELYPHRPNLLHRKLLWGGPVLLAFLLDISPVARRLYTCSWNNQAVLLHSLQVVLFLLAALFFSCPVPECLSPGGFDILGHSRQLLQVLLTLSIVCQQEALLQDFSWRRAGLVRRVGEESLLWSCAVFSVVTLSCSVTALALRRCRVPR